VYGHALRSPPTQNVQAYFHQPHGAAKPDDENEHEAVHAADKRLFKKDRKPQVFTIAGGCWLVSWRSGILSGAVF